MYAEDADREFWEDMRQQRVDAVRRARPPRLSLPGSLHPEIAGWVERLRVGSAGNLGLKGPVGTGKTSSIWEALEQAAIGGYTGKWMFVDPTAWQGIIAPTRLDHDRLALMCSVDLLIADDLGSSRVNEWEREKLFSVIDTRWAHARPTVISTNINDVEEAYGPRIYSRLVGGGITVVLLDGPDRRRI